MSNFKAKMHQCAHSCRRLYLNELTSVDVDHDPQEKVRVIYQRTILHSMKALVASRKYRTVIVYIIRNHLFQSHWARSRIDRLALKPNCKSQEYFITPNILAKLIHQSVDQTPNCE